MPGPLVTIKRPDGTIEKITLDDFRARQKAKQATVAVPVKKFEAIKPEPVKIVSRPEGTPLGPVKTEPVKPAPSPVKPAPAPRKAEPPKPLPASVKPEPATIKKSEPPKPAPVPVKISGSANQAPRPAPRIIEPPKTVKPPAKAAQPAENFTKDDAKSLLEEELPVMKPGTPLASKGRAKEAEEIYRKLNLPLAPDVRNRLFGLIELRLKDVRSEDEVRDWLVLPEKQMGIGLAADKAGLVLKICREYAQKTALSAQADVAPLKRPPGIPTAPQNAPAALMKEDREPLPAKDAPFNSFVHAPQTRKSATEPGLSPQKEPVARPIVRDIAPAVPVNLGPVEEVKYISLVDFRRLSSDAAEAASRLKQKFLNMKDESYILFINCLEAWRQSPLFLEYIGVSIEALNSRKKLADVIIDKNKIQMGEIQAIIQMEKELL